MNSGKFKIVFVYALICLIWGSTWLAIRIGLESMTPFMSAGFRFVAASLFIITLMRFRRIPMPLDKKSVRLYLMMAFFSFAIPFALVYWAEQFVPSGLAAVLFAVYPFFVALFSWMMIPDEEIGIWKIAGMIAAFAGIAVIFSDQFGEDLSLYFWGMLAVVLSGIMQAAIAVKIKRDGRHLNPLSMNFFPMLISGVFLLIVGLFTEDVSSLKFDARGVYPVLYLAFFGSVVTFTSYYWLLKKINIILLSVIAFITPVIALILGWLLYDEKLLAHHIAGSGIVLAGLLIVNLSGFLKQYKLRQVTRK